MDFTCAIGTVCVVLSSPAKVISDDEVAVTVPASVVPSRIKMVACGPEAGLFAHEARKKRVHSVAPAKMVRHMGFDVHARPLEALHAAWFIVTSNQPASSLGAGSRPGNSIAKLEAYLLSVKSETGTMAKQLHANQSQLDRLLDRQNVSMMLDTITRSALALYPESRTIHAEQNSGL